MDFPWCSCWLQWEVKRKNRDKENIQHPWGALLVNASFKCTDGAPTDKCDLSNIYFETQHCST